MIVAIHSQISDDARLLVSDPEAFMSATTNLASSILEEAIAEMRSEFTGQIGQVLTIHRLMQKINDLSKHVEGELLDIWDQEGLRVLTLSCEFESPTQFRMSVGTSVTNLSTCVH